jgi:hypothetical protein
VKDLRGVGYFDQARYSDPNDTAPKYTVLSLGANHRYFTGFWYTEDWKTPNDSFCGSPGGEGRISASDQQSFSASYAAAFFRRHLLGQKQFDTVLRGDTIPSSMQTNTLHYGYMPAAKDRLDINRLVIPGELSSNTLGGAVATFLVTANSLCGDSDNCAPWLNDPDYRTPHETLTALPLSWHKPFVTAPTYSNFIPALNSDFTRFSTLQFRAAVDQTSLLNSEGDPQDFSVILTDRGGHSKSIAVHGYAVGRDAPLYYPPGEFKAAIMNTIRIRTDDFTGLDRTTIVSVKFQFDRVAN